MIDQLPVGDLTYVSSKRASEISSYAQDYIGQLARSGQIDGKRIGGLWYVDMKSLDLYRSNSESLQSAQTPQIKSIERDVDVPVVFDSKEYISASRASKITRYNQDYIGQLARSGKITSRQIGNRWYVDLEAIRTHKAEKDALFAKVQADSLGLNQAPALAAIYKDLPLLNYSIEEVDLSPQIESKTYSEAHVHGRDTYGTQKAGPIGYQIPIHVIQSKPLYKGKDVIFDGGYSLEPSPLGKSRFLSKIVLIPAFTLVVVASVGFASFKLSFKDIVNSSRPAMLATVVATGLNLINVMASNFEELVVPAITYKRSDQY